MFMIACSYKSTENSHGICTCVQKMPNFTRTWKVVENDRVRNRNLELRSHENYLSYILTFCYQYSIISISVYMYIVECCHYYLYCMFMFLICRGWSLYGKENRRTDSPKEWTAALYSKFLIYYSVSILYLHLTTSFVHVVMKVLLACDMKCLFSITLE